MESLYFVSIDEDGFAEPPTPLLGLVTHADKMADQGEGGVPLPPIHLVLIFFPQAPGQAEVWPPPWASPGVRRASIQTPLGKCPRALHTAGSASVTVITL